MGVIKQRHNNDNGGSGDDGEGSSSTSSCTCYLAFRGTTNNVQDWLQNFDVRKTVLFDGSDDDADCIARKGFTNFLRRNNFYEALHGLELCLFDYNNNNSDGSDDCDLIITGHSQGGACTSINCITYSKCLVSFCYIKSYNIWTDTCIR
jgi:hypothetical protein